MAISVSVLLALVVLGSSPARSLDCDLRLSHSSPETFTLLSQMERASILSCLKDRTDFSFPQILVDGNQLEETQVTAVVHEVLQQIFNLFSKDESFVTWNETLLDKFLVGLYQQLHGLETCWREEKNMEHLPLGNENSRLAVKRYFQTISFYLKEKEYSRCAWEVVRVEIRRCLFLVNKVTERFRR
ncbi:interferon alpha-2-like [Suricata suricatta]|uniref:interferon alpha-2-like n=1 Tax=Suricata suricatta TaxID=37032 RepID=UPI001155CF6F|nr:interferon alpha-2-like [Suricata suricatta]